MKKGITRIIDFCPHCKANLEDKEHPGFTRKIGIYDRKLDITVMWQCPDCSGRWERK